MIDKLYQFLFSQQARSVIERSILGVAITGFVVHLCMIYLNNWGWLSFQSTSELLKNPIAAAYTPFSFILVYEVYLLIFPLPRSITTYISKQSEIITLTFSKTSATPRPTNFCAPFGPIPTPSIPRNTPPK